MSEPIDSRWLDSAPDKKRFVLALGSALLLELATFALLLPAMTHQEAPSDTQSVVKLSLVAAAPAPRPPLAPKPVRVPAKPVMPPPTPPPPPLPLAPPMPPPPPAENQVTHLFRHYVKPNISPPAPLVAAPAPPAPPQPTGPPAPTGGEVDAFSAAIKRALQAHANAVYPAQAQMARETGAPVLTFTYLNGAVSDIQLARSSGFPLLDAAALEDARIATYPPAPPAFTGRTEYITVAVNFQLAAPSADDD